MDPITIVLATALGKGLVGVGKLLVEKGLLEEGVAKSLAEPMRRQVEKWVTGPLDERALQQAFAEALTAAGEPVAEDEEKITRWLKQVGLDRLVAKQNNALRHQFARAVIGFTDPDAEPPEDLIIALAWPRTQRKQLSGLLFALRQQLASLDEWRPLIAYANDMARQGQLQAILEKLARFDNLFVQTDAGEALRVVAVQSGVSEEEAAAIEEDYRRDLTELLELHTIRGIKIPNKPLPHLPLADIYTELGLLGVTDKRDSMRLNEKIAVMSEKERWSEEERRLRERITDALAHNQRVVILGDPGSGKTISLKFITLMLAKGCGAARLGLDKPYIPLMIRVSGYAERLKTDPTLSLDNYLLEVITKKYTTAGADQLRQFLHLALKKGACMVLLDGLDEVADDPVIGKTLRSDVAEKIQNFADLWSRRRGNRLVVSSRIVGYWDEPLHNFFHAHISPLEPPDDVHRMLRNWYAAYQKWQNQSFDDDQILSFAESRADAMMTRIMASTSVRRMATNPLLLTILALSFENVRDLPDHRVELYETATKTLIISWRNAQSRLNERLRRRLRENTVFSIMSQLAYWLHEKYPGGVAPLEVWETQLSKILQDYFPANDALDVAERFLYHARHETGILAERGLGQYGFFHLTFEEYLAGYEIARQRESERREMLQAHWREPRWREAILLAAGQLGIINNQTDDVSDFVNQMLSLRPIDFREEGRQVVLAGRALVDIGLYEVGSHTRWQVEKRLKHVMQDLDPTSEKPNNPGIIPIRTRHEAGIVLDDLLMDSPEEVEKLFDDLNAWVRIDPDKLPPQPVAYCSVKPFYALRLPVTNAQFERFVLAKGYEHSGWWSDEGWIWRTREHPDYRGGKPVAQPEYWHNMTFGREHRSLPVVGVSHYEAEAFAKWLTWLLAQLRTGKEVKDAERALVAGLLQVGAPKARLPTRKEWVIMAGGLANKKRYPWDSPRGPATESSEDVIQQANTDESNINRTSPVSTYPLGRSQPFGLFDLAGNVWEWTDTPYNHDPEGRLVCGGSWGGEHDLARVANRGGYLRIDSLGDLGFRLVAPIEF